MLPLSALLSQALVAFTIEFDNEFEHRAPHQTSRYGPEGRRDEAPWLVSMAMWMKIMRFVPEQGVSIAEFKRASGLDNKDLKTWLTRMGRWWGYLSVDMQSCQIRPTAGGLTAIRVWRPLTAEIEERWCVRFGAAAIQELTALLQGCDGPDYLPILGYDLRTDGKMNAARGADSDRLQALLSRRLFALASEFEQRTKLSMAICANLLRVGQGARIRDLQRLSGVSKEAIAMALKRAQEAGRVLIEQGKVLVLTDDGQRARETYLDQRESSEPRLREILAGLTFSEGLTPYPDGWRSKVPSPETLPHYPMVLHRGGFPDGS